MLCFKISLLTFSSPISTFAFPKIEWPIWEMEIVIPIDIIKSAIKRQIIIKDDKQIKIKQYMTINIGHNKIQIRQYNGESKTWKQAKTQHIKIITLFIKIIILHNKILIIKIKIIDIHKNCKTKVKQIQNKILKKHIFTNNNGKDKQEHSNKIIARQKLPSIPIQNEFKQKYRIQHGTLNTKEK